MSDPFARRVSEGMKRSGLTLRSFCREVDLDPSFFSKVLSGKRSPPSEEEVLRKIASRLSLDAAELIVSAGRIPAEWRAVYHDSELFHSMNEMVTGRSSRTSIRLQPPKGVGRTESAKKPEPKPIQFIARRQEMSEELL